MTAEEIETNDAMVGRAARRRDQASERLRKFNETLDSYRSRIEYAATVRNDWAAVNEGRGVMHASRDELLHWPSVQDVGQALHDQKQAERELQEAISDLKRLGLKNP